MPRSSSSRSKSKKQQPQQPAVEVPSSTAIMTRGREGGRTVGRRGSGGGGSPTSEDTSAVRLAAFFFNTLSYVAFLGQGQYEVAAVYAGCSILYWTLHAGLRVDSPRSISGDELSSGGGVKSTDPRAYRRGGLLAFAVSIFLQWFGGALNPFCRTASLTILLLSEVASFPLSRVLRWSTQKTRTVRVGFYLMWSTVRLLDLTFTGNFWFHVTLLQAYVVLLMGSAAQIRTDAEEEAVAMLEKHRAAAAEVEHGGVTTKERKEEEEQRGSSSSVLLGAEKRMRSNTTTTAGSLLICVKVAVIALVRHFTVPCTKRNLFTLVRHLLVFVSCVLSLGLLVPAVSRLSSGSSLSSPTFMVPWPWEEQTLTLSDLYVAPRSRRSSSSSEQTPPSVHLCTRSVENPALAFLGGIHSVVVVNGYVWENYPDPTGTGIPLPFTTWVNASGTISLASTLASAAAAGAAAATNSSSSTYSSSLPDGLHRVGSTLEALPKMELLGKLAVPPVEHLWGTDWNAVRTFPIAQTTADGFGGDRRRWYRCQDMGSLLPSGTNQVESQEMLRRLITRFVETNERYNLVVKPSNCHNLAVEVLCHVASKTPSTTPDVTTRFFVLFILLGICFLEVDRIRFLIDAVVLL